MLECQTVLAAPAPLPRELFTMAFQPVVNTNTLVVTAYEATFCGPNGEGPAAFAAALPESARPTFDLRCRVAALEQAIELGVIDRRVRLAVKVMPTYIADPLADAERMQRIVRRLGFPARELVLEFSDRDHLESDHMVALVKAYRKLGFLIAFDDFGAGDMGLELLSLLTPDTLKLAPELVHSLSTSWARRLVVERVVEIARKGRIRLIAEGVDTRAEHDRLHSLGVSLMQGEAIAPRQVGALPAPALRFDGAN
ncbi:EAL domain-containing protein [Sphingomonas pokkalii]|uniref:EAL domain-containing protein n=1 Tax=Sphingomonas pokkalii TaxID=2175090 RepID=A0A2U0SBL8_9SPHN|nr:EAL domain-containing protein [Sphingomonas pokkalii]PVX28763.1 EAL domain-containing protein [Sphingomonas pokkalii]